MIQLDVESYCHDCSDFYPVVRRLYANACVYQQSVTCEHIQHCRKICDYVRRCHEREAKGESDESVQI